MSSWDKANRGEKLGLVWFGEIERKLAKLSMTTFTYRSSSKLFYDFSTVPAGRTGRGRARRGGWILGGQAKVVFSLNFFFI
jgi:hypothetical protein